MISGTSVAILSSVFPPEKRCRVMGIIVGCTYLGLSLGSVLSGFMVTHLGRRWIFYLGVLIELFCLTLTLLKLKGEWAEARGERYDRIGAMLYCVSLFCLIYGTLNQKNGGGYHLLMGLGFSLFSSPNTTAIMGSITPRHYGIASSFMATMRTLGMLGCMTVITLIFHYFMGINQ